MNRHARLPNCIMIFAALVIAAGSIARGEIPVTVKTADDVTQSASAIAQTIKANVDRLKGGEPAAREALVSDALINNQIKEGTSTASPAFLDAYADALNRELLPLAQEKNVAVRLNAAIVAARVAQLANNARLADAITAFAKDKSEPVALWGIRGARWVIPALLRGPFANPKHALIATVVDAVKSHPEGQGSGWLAMDAYDALTMDVFDQARRKKLTPQMLAASVEPLQNLLAVRLDQYKVGVPASASAERSGTRYLTDAAVWQLETPAQQTRTVQLLSDLMSLAAQQAQQANPGDLSELAVTISFAAKGLSVAAEGAQQPGIVDALKAATAIAKGTSPQQIQAAVQAVYPAIKASSKFSAVTPPPAVQDHKAAPAPASAPSTLPAGAGPSTLPPPPPLPPAPEPAAPPVRQPPAGGPANRPPGGTPPRTPPGRGAGAP
jgi:hypothetical protein